jgi:hypothetical protein
VWFIGFHVRFFGQRGLAHIGNHADHGHPVLLVSAETFSDRVLIRPAAARHGFVDDRDRRPGGIVLVEEAAFEQLDLERPEVLRIDAPVHNNRFLAGWGRGRSLDDHRLAAFRVAERQVRNHASRFHPQHLIEALKQRPIEVYLLPGPPIGFAGQSQVGR